LNVKDFDQERVAHVNDELREFTIGGERFTVRVASEPAVYVRYWDGLRDSTSADGTLTNADFVAILDDTVAGLIEPDQADRWRQVRDHADPPITIRTISEVVDYCMAVQNGRPPTPSASSSNGSAQPPSGESSTAASGSPAVEGSQS
jgi:hypothetical protein